MTEIAIILNSIAQNYSHLKEIDFHDDLNENVKPLLIQGKYFDINRFFNNEPNQNINSRLKKTFSYGIIDDLLSFEEELKKNIELDYNTMISTYVNNNGEEIVKFSDKREYAISKLYLNSSFKSHVIDYFYQLNLKDGDMEKVLSVLSNIEPVEQNTQWFFELLDSIPKISQLKSFYSKLDSSLIQVGLNKEPKYELNHKRVSYPPFGSRNQQNHYGVARQLLEKYSEFPDGGSVAYANFMIGSRNEEEIIDKMNSFILARADFRSQRNR